jgi:hypothetical protein
MVYVSDLKKNDIFIDYVSPDYIYNQLKSGFSRLLLSDKDITKINEYCGELNGLLPYSRMVEKLKQTVL